MCSTMCYPFTPPPTSRTFHLDKWKLHLFDSSTPLFPPSPWEPHFAPCLYESLGTCWVLWLADFTQVHLYCWWHNFMSFSGWLIIALHVSATFCLSAHEHVGCFHLSASVNDTAMKTSHGDYSCGAQGILLFTIFRAQDYGFSTWSSVFGILWFFDSLHPVDIS